MSFALLKRRALSLIVTGFVAVHVGSITPVGASSSAALTYRGPTLDALRVVVAVSIVVLNKRIVAVKPTVFVRTARSLFITGRALRILNREVLQAQGADIHIVSGATITSDAYMTSLQAAVNKAYREKTLGPATTRP
jgi:uncharacterized protein with FMN-binding domain